MQSDSDHLVHDEDGQLANSVEFPYGEVQASLGDPPPEDDETEFSPEEIDAACKVFRSLVSWIWQSGMKNTDGITIRAIIVCWIFLNHLHPLSLTEIARGFGKKKQSLGRWVEDFKRRFPQVKTCHMKQQ